MNRNSIFILWALHIAPCCISLVQAGTPTLGAKALIGDNQQYRVSARITTGNGVSLSGVSITEKGTKNRVVSAQDGTFRLLVSSSESIVVLSYVGYSSQEYTADRVPQQIILTPDAQSLEQVVVTGYQKLDKSRFTGSVSQVEKATIDRSGYVDVSRMLQGAAAGVSVQNVSGTFGSTPKIRIRGNASISANQEPLYVLNGVPITSPANVSVSQLYSGDPASMLGSAIAGLNAQDIEDIVILKDGAATSLYGTRAANGVISIRTKTGKPASKPTVNFNTAISIGQKPTISKYNRMNAAQEMDLYKELFDRGYFSNNNWPSMTGAFTDAYRRYALREINQEQAYEELNRSAQVNTDWFGTLFRNNILQEHSLSFTGGKKRVSYYLSGSYAKDDGQAIGYDMDRITANLQTGIQVTDAFHIDVNANLSARNQLAPGTYNSGTLYSDVTRNFEINPAIYAMSASRAMYPYQADGNYKYYLNNYAPFNIIEELKENFTELKSNEIRFQLRPSYQLLPTLRYELTLAYQASHSDTDHIVTEKSNVANAYRVDYNDVLREENELLYRDPTDPYAYYQTILPEGGFLYANRYRGKMYHMRHSLNFKKNWALHALDATAGFEWNHDRTDRTYRKGIGYRHYDSGTINPSELALMQVAQTGERLYEETFKNQYLIGYYVSAQYAFKNRYNLEAGGRLDASNMFGKRARSKFLPNYSLGLSWNVERESFMQPLLASGALQYLKLRGSYALRGNAYQTSPQRYAKYFQKVRLDNANSEQIIDILSPELYNLSWEKDYIGNLALEVGLWNKIDLVAEAYQRKNKDLISEAAVALEEGFGTKVINFASMKNTGIDITIGLKNLLSSPDWHWNMQGVYGFVRNRVTDGELQSSLLTQITRANGYPLKGYPLEGLYAYQYSQLDLNGRPVFSNNGRSVQGISPSAQDRGLIRYIGSRQPLGTGSFSNTIGYKGFEMRIFFTFSHGNHVFMQPIAARSYSDNVSSPADLAYRWRGPGDESYTDIPGILSSIERLHLATVSQIDELAYNRSDLRVADASVLRLAELMLSYELQPDLLKSVGGIKRARLSLSGNNLKYWASKKLNGMDPELLLTGVALPNPVSYSLRITAGF